MILEAAFWIGCGLSASGSTRWCRPCCPPAFGGAFVVDCAETAAADFFIELIDVEVTADLDSDGGTKGMAWVPPEADPGIEQTNGRQSTRHHETETVLILTIPQHFWGSDFMDFRGEKS